MMINLPRKAKAFRTAHVFPTNTFPHSYSNIGETNLPSKLLPTYNGVECCCLAVAKARRVCRKEETVTRAGAGENHSRVWSRMSNLVAG
ncbi:hypothetical protein PS1_038252 [Malus domestica]